MAAVSDRGRWCAPCPRAFSLLDLLVSITVIAVLIAIMLPALKGVRDLANRVICASNARQSAIGIQMHSDEREGEIPESISVSIRTQTFSAPQDMIAVRRPESPRSWDGLGWLYRRDYLAVPDVYYCPAHVGDHPVSRYAGAWQSASPQTTVVINYQYRGAGPSTSHPMRLTNLLWDIRPRAALVTDGLRTQSDFNHENGTNVVRADLSVGWLADRGIKAGLPEVEEEADSPSKVRDAWEAIDSGGNGSRAGRSLGWR